MSSTFSDNVTMELNTQILQENWAWVDQRLEELYHCYGLTEDNYDDYIESGLLSERWAWVDEKLEKHTDYKLEDTLPCPAPMSWVRYQEYPKQFCLEDEDTLPRSRAESDISDHSAEVERVLRRLDIQSPLPQIDYSYLYDATDEDVSVNSMDKVIDNCTTISNCSNSPRVFDSDDVHCYDSPRSRMIFEIDNDYYDFGYDSF